MITPDEATENYSGYKVTERKKHVQQFFIAHQNEEW